MTDEIARPAPARAGGVLKALGWSVRRGLLAPRYWAYALRFVALRLRHPDVETAGFVFLSRGVQIEVRRGLGRVRLGAWVWIGRGTALRCHEGNLRIGDKVVLGGDVTVNAYLDIEIGAETIVADAVYVTDFDHKYADPTTPIRKQGIVTSPVSIGRDCWIGTKAVVTRGVTIGDGSVITAQAAVVSDVPSGSVAGGVPARVLKRRGDPQRR